MRRISKSKKGFSSTEFLGLILVIAIIALTWFAIKGNVVTPLKSFFGLVDGVSANSEEVQLYQKPEIKYSFNNYIADIPESPAEPPPVLTPGEKPRVLEQIKKPDFKKAVSDACNKVMGSCTPEQVRAVYAITIIERGVGKDTINAYDWNFGNLQVRNGLKVYFSDLNLPAQDYGKNYNDYYAKLNNYIAQNPSVKANLKTNVPFYWSYDNSYDASGKVKPYFVQFQAFDSPASGLYKKIDLLKRVYPDSLNQASLASAPDNAAFARVVAQGMKHGVGGLQYYEANVDSYAAGIVTGLRDYDKLG
jgi:hypothetical protein